ncbi:MAG: hypothetical protein MZU97_07340 [Bacillus subtilis]|nr:hypothetical protein [Bacillus subtilis]
MIWNKPTISASSQVIEFEVAILFGEPLGEGQQDCGREQSNGGLEHGLTEKCFDGIFQQIASQQGGDGGDDDVKTSQVSVSVQVSDVAKVKWYALRMLRSEQVFPVEGEQRDDACPTGR